METKVVKIDRTHPDTEQITEAGRLLREGGLVAFPTETVYGLGGDGLQETAAARIYAAKGRPSDNPLILHIAEVSDIEKLAVDIPPLAYRLAEKFWPGPMTMILKKAPMVPYATTGGLDTVAVRRNCQGNYQGIRHLHCGAKRQFIRQAEPNQGGACD